MQRAILLLGPTGSGKTPLGDKLERSGLCGRTCVHFDFGEHLRRVVARGIADDVVSEQDIGFLRGVLQTGALLTDEDFPIAQRVLATFLLQRCVAPDTVVVLNGLPRHEGQARALDETWDVSQVILLECSPAVVRQRIAANTGGDRAQRRDDGTSDVERKLGIYTRQTAPLIEFYRARGVVIARIRVEPTTTADDLYAAVAR